MGDPKFWYFEKRASEPKSKMEGKRNEPITMALAATAQFQMTEQRVQQT